MENDLISRLNSKIEEITTANIAIHKETGDIREWVDNWREEMACISESLLAILTVLGDDGR